MPRLIASVLLIGAALALIGCPQASAPPAAAPPPAQGVYVPGFGPEIIHTPVPATAPNRPGTAPAPAATP